MLCPNIPLQLQGEFQDNVSMQFLETFEMTIKNFEKTRIRLLSVQKWHSISNYFKTKRTIHDFGTAQSTTALKMDNLICIKTPGLGNPSGIGYACTKITEMQIGK